MSEAKRFWCHEAQNIRCVRESDYDAALAREAQLRADREDDANTFNTAFEKLQGIEAALRNELALLKNEDLKFRALLEQEGEIKSLKQRLAETDKRAVEAEELLKASLEALCECRSLLHAHTTSPQCSRSKMHGEIGLARIDRLTDKLRSALTRQL